MGNCKCCTQALNNAIFKEIKGRIYKSCPNCSRLNGEYHVFYPYPESFGTTKKRSSTLHPEGPQSYCERCRGGNPPCNGILCCD